MPTLTIYVVSANLTMLNAIFNGVAMICQQTAFIWGFATLASTWIILSATAKTPISSISGNAQNVLTTGSLGAFMPFVLAMLLTFPGLQSKVQVQSTMNGTITVIDNVPFVISVIPAVGSILSQQAGTLIETAYQSTGTDYASISASGNGFINPLKVLLASRSAVSRLNDIAPQIKAIVTSCLPPDAGIDYPTVTNLVMNAGNTGATAAQSLPINGADNTSIGALLYQAQLSNNYVPTITDASNNILNCNDAANLVVTRIDNALQSAEFSRVVQGAVNGMDQPTMAANLNINNLTSEWSATRNANDLNALTGISSMQAQNEVINLIFSEVVNNELSCLATSGQSKIICESSIVQANEIERNNIQMAAAEVPMLKYAGSFGNYLLALIIGLGPLVVMFMMFAGVNAGKCIKTVAHLIAWPLLVMNVGAELINGMIYISLADFAKGIANGGVISQAVNTSIYRELSFQVGSASHMMASLPVLMGMIFALGESAALVNVGTNIAPKTNDVSDSVSPIYNKQEPIMSSTGAGGHNTVRTDGVESYASGSQQLMNASNQYGGSLTRATNAISNVDSAVKSTSQVRQVVKDASTTFSKQDRKGWGLTDSASKAFDEFQARNNHQSAAYTNNDGTTSTADSGSNTTASATARVGGGTGGGGKNGAFPISAGGEVQATKTTTGGQSIRSNVGSSKTDTEANNKDTGQRLANVKTWLKEHHASGDAIKSVDNRIAQHKSYTESLTNNDTVDKLKSKALEDSQGVVGYANNSVTATEFAASVNRKGSELGMYVATEGNKLTAIPAIKERMDKIDHDAKNGVTSDIVGDEKGRNAAILFKAAALSAQDENLSKDERYAAAAFVTGALSTMVNGSMHPNKPMQEPSDTLDKAQNITGTALAPILPAAAPKNNAHKHVKNNPDKALDNFTANFSNPLEPNFNPKAKYLNDDNSARLAGLGDHPVNNDGKVYNVMHDRAQPLTHEVTPSKTLSTNDSNQIKALTKPTKKFSLNDVFNK